MNFRIIYLSIYLFMVFQSASAGTTCFLTAENGRLIKQEGHCEKRYPPCSTFKIAISLMGYDANILENEKTPIWQYKPGDVDWLEQWKQPHDPTSWFKNSCVWYSQKITYKLGMQRFQDYLKQLAYGNQDVSGDKGAQNGLTHSWLSSSLAISPYEQLLFIQKLIGNQLPVSLASQEATKKIMLVDSLSNGWKLYGKTGNGSQLDQDGQKIQDRQVGWFVGFASKDKQVISFVYLIVDEDKQEIYASLRAKEAIKHHFQQIL